MLQVFISGGLLTVKQTEDCLLILLILLILIIKIKMLLIDFKRNNTKKPKSKTRRKYNPTFLSHLPQFTMPKLPIRYDSPSPMENDAVMRSHAPATRTRSKPYQG